MMQLAQLLNDINEQYVGRYFRICDLIKMGLDELSIISS